MINKELENAIHDKFAGTGIKYIITTDPYGSGYSTIYVNRFIFDHAWFNKRGFGIIVTI